MLHRLHQQGQKAGDDERVRMLEILQRLKLQDEQGGAAGEGGEDGEEGDDKDDDTDGPGLSTETLERLVAKLQRMGPDAAEGGISALEVDESDLAPGDLRAFRRALAEGRLAHLIEPYRPWWLAPEAREIAVTVRGTRPVQEVGAAEAEGEAEAPSSAPPPPFTQPLPALSSLTGPRAPSPLLRFSLLDLIYGYCFLLRHLNGEVGQQGGGPPEETLAELDALSRVCGALLPGTPPASTRDAVARTLEASCRALAGQPGARAWSVALLSDVAALLATGRGALLCLLAHVDRLLAGYRAAAEELAARGKMKKATSSQPSQPPGGSGRGSAGASTASSSSSSAPSAKDVFLMQKKLTFLAAWTNEQDDAVFDHLAVQVRIELTALGEGVGTGGGGEGVLGPAGLEALNAAAGASGPAGWAPPTTEAGAAVAAVKMGAKVVELPG
jgi:hypothetical protein